jgi:hypothetical protein
MGKVRDLHDRAFQRRRQVTCEELFDAIEADEDAAAKSRELPEEVRSIVDQLRRSHIADTQAQVLVSFIDANFPKPKSQAEQDAEYLEEHARGCFPETAGKHRAIAKRLREGKTP